MVRAMAYTINVIFVSVPPQYLSKQNFGKV